MPQGRLCKKVCPLIVLSSIYHRAIIFHGSIGLGDYMKLMKGKDHNDLGFPRLNVKVTRNTCKLI